MYLRVLFPSATLPSSSLFFVTSQSAFTVGWLYVPCLVFAPTLCSLLLLFARREAWPVSDLQPGLRGSDSKYYNTPFYVTGCCIPLPSLGAGFLHCTSWNRVGAQLTNHLVTGSLKCSSPGLGPGNLVAKSHDSSIPKRCPRLAISVPHLVTSWKLYHLRNPITDLKPSWSVPRHLFCVIITWILHFLSTVSPKLS